MKDMNLTEKLHFQFHKCFKLLHRNLFDIKLESIRVMPHRGQGRVLRMLLENNEMALKDIIQEMDIRPSSAWELIEKLERSGFVEKTANQEDKRCAIIKLTEAGRKEAVLKKYDLRGLNDDLYVGLNDEEKEQLSVLLEKLTESLKQNEDIPPMGRNDFFDERVRRDFGKRIRDDWREGRKVIKDIFTKKSDETEEQVREVYAEANDENGTSEN